ncbi:unnamed protein product [Calypogeia fissa]
MRIWHSGPRLSPVGSWLHKNSRRCSWSGDDPQGTLWLHLVLSLLLLCPATAVSYHQISVASLQAFRISLKNPSVLTSWGHGDPCSSGWRGVECIDNFTIASLKLSNLQLTGTLSPLVGQLTTLTTLWLDSNSFVGPIPSQLGELTNLTSLRLSNNFFNGSVPESLGMIPNLKELYLFNNDLSGTLPFTYSATRGTRIVVDGNNQLCSLLPGYGVPVCGPSLAPALIFGPVAAIPSPAKGKNHVAAIVGGVAGAVVLIVFSVIFVACCLFRAKSWPSATSDTGSSDPSAQVDWAKGPEAPLVGGAPAVVPETHTAKVFSLEELEHATKKFSTNNLIGEGGFGFVYKGLLEDGTIVAVKRRSSNASRDFAMEVDALAQVQHRNLVSILGFCQENDQQMVVYDYVPNGSVCGHLYDTDGFAVGEFDFKQRLSIAVGAAKGLEQLHTMTPSVVHRDFKTNNVLLDASLVAKVTDFGLSRLLSEGRLLQEGPVLVPSSSGDGTAGFLDPEYYKTQRLTRKSDVFSFGVFLLELISGREAICMNRPRPEWSLVEWGRSLLQAGNLGALVDSTLGSNYMEPAMRKVVEVGFKCVEPTGRKRPDMTEVFTDLEVALEMERGLATGGGDGTATVTLGSELFT